MKYVHYILAIVNSKRRKRIENYGKKWYSYTFLPGVHFLTFCVHYNALRFSFKKTNEIKCEEKL